jgi:CBS domain-containing protein
MTMQVRDVMTRNVISVPANETILEAARNHMTGRGQALRTIVVPKEGLAADESTARALPTMVRSGLIH